MTSLRLHTRLLIWSYTEHEEFKRKNHWPRGSFIHFAVVVVCWHLHNLLKLNCKIFLKIRINLNCESFKECSRPWTDFQSCYPSKLWKIHLSKGVKICLLVLFEQSTPFIWIIFQSRKPPNCFCFFSSQKWNNNGCNCKVKHISKLIQQRQLASDGRLERSSLLSICEIRGVIQRASLGVDSEQKEILFEGSAASSRPTEIEFGWPKILCVRNHLTFIVCFELWSFLKTICGQFFTKKNLHAFRKMHSALQRIACISCIALPIFKSAGIYLH